MRGALFFLLYLSILPAALSAGYLAIILYIWASFIAPESIIYDFLGQLPYSKIAIIVTFIAVLTEKFRNSPYVDFIYTFMLLFFFQCLLSFGFSLTDGPQFYAVADRLWKIALLCILINSVVRGRLQIHSLILVIGITMGVQGALEGLKFIASAGGHIVIPPGNFGDNNSFALFVLMNTPILMYLLWYTVDPFVRLTIVGGILINIFAIVGSGSRGAFVGMLAVALAVILQSKHRVATLLVVAVIGSGIAWTVPSRLYNRFDTIQNASEDGSFMSRVTAWKTSTIVALDRPLLGGGFSAIEDRKLWATFLPKFSSLDFIPSPSPDAPRAAHSVYFQVLGDTGFIGLMLYLGLLAATFWSIYKIRRATAADARLGWAYDLAGYLRLTMIALVVSGSTVSVAFYDFPFIVFCLVSVLRRTIATEALTDKRQGNALGGRSLNRMKIPQHALALERPKVAARTNH